MATLAPATTRSPRSWARAIALQPLLVPLASLLVAVAVLGAGPRLLIVVALPALAIGAIAHRLPRPARAAVALLLGVLALGAGLISRSDALVVAGTLFLLAGVSSGWGVNRGRRRRRAWTNRLLAIVGAVLVGFFVVFPTLLAVDFLAKPRASINQAALGLPHERRRWYVPSHNGAAVVLVHGGGGDRQGTILHAQMLASAGYGVLLYDARGRGESAGHENAAGWQWDRDVRGAVSFLTGRGINHVGVLGLSTGAKRSSPRQPRTGASKRSLRTASRPAPPPTPATPRSVIGSRSSPASPSPVSRSDSHATNRNRGP